MTNALMACAGKSTSSVGPLLAHHHRNAPDDVLVADTLRASGAGRAPDHGMIAFHTTQDPIHGAVSPALGCEPGSIGVLTFDEQQITSAENRARPRSGDPAPTLAKQSRIDVLGDMRPRRLTPREWERLQGFPDDWTLIDGAADSPRYEALGNSMAVPVMRWIGERLKQVDALLHDCVPCLAGAESKGAG